MKTEDKILDLLFEIDKLKRILDFKERFIKCQGEELFELREKVKEQGKQNQKQGE